MKKFPHGSPHLRGAAMASMCHTLESLEFHILYDVRKKKSSNQACFFGFPNVFGPSIVMNLGNINIDYFHIQLNALSHFLRPPKKLIFFYSHMTHVANLYVQKNICN